MKMMFVGRLARVLSLALALIIISGLIMPVALAQAGEFTATVTGGALRLRQKPDDNAKVLGRYYDGIEFRGFEHQMVEDELPSFPSTN